MTIGRLIKEVKPSNEEYEIRLITSRKKSAVGGLRSRMGVKLSPHRTLRSYRLKSSDILVLHVAVTNSGIWRNVAGTEKLAVVVSIPQPWNLSKAMKMDANSCLGDVKREFLTKIYLNVPPSMYGIYVNVEKQGGPQEELVSDQMPLASLSLPTPMRMACRLLPQKPQKLFGVDPEKLEMAEDGGLQIPRVLLILKELLLVNNGLTVEGLFRRSGSETQMKIIRQQLEEGKEVSTKDVHTVATLIKRWFKELPARLLVTPKINLENVAGDPKAKLELPTFLTPLYARLLTWLYDLCCVLMRNYESTKMDAKNLAIVWGPAVVPESSVVTLGSFAESNNDILTTGYGVDLVEANLRYFAASEERPIDRLRTLVPDAIPAVPQERLMAPGAADRPRSRFQPPSASDPFDAFHSSPPAFRPDPKPRKKTKSIGLDGWKPVKPRVFQSSSPSPSASATSNLFKLRARGDSRAVETDPIPEPREKALHRSRSGTAIGITPSAQRQPGHVSTNFGSATNPVSGGNPSSLPHGGNAVLRTGPFPPTGARPTSRPPPPAVVGPPPAVTGPPPRPISRRIPPPY